MQDIFIDSINLHNGFLKKSLPPNPILFAINDYGIMQLFKFAECNTKKRLHTKIDDQNLRKIKNININCINKIPCCFIPTKLLKKKHSLTKFYGNLHAGNMH